MKEVQKRVYVATPYGSLKCQDDMRDYLAQNIARQECIKIMHAGYEPVSAVLELSGKLDENTQRELALELGLKMLEECDHIYVCDHPDVKDSKGIAAELEYAKKLGLSQLKLNKNGSAELVLWM